MSLKSDFLSSFGKTLSDRFNIPKNLSKKRITKDLFIPDIKCQIKNNMYINEKIKEECSFNINELKKRIKLFNKEKKENSENKYINNEENNIFKKIFKGYNYRYHNNHILRMETLKKRGLLKKINIQAQSPNFSPKYDFLYHKIITGPKWDNISDRSKNLFNKQNSITNLTYNDNSNYFKDNIKGFIDMSKQIERKGILEIQNDKIKQEKLNNEENPILSIFSKISNNESSLFKKNDYEEKHKYVPDFNRYMSREQLNKLFKNKKKRITNEEIFPNYRSIEIGTKMMVFYNTAHNHKLKDNRLNNSYYSYKNINFSPNKIFEKIYGNKLKVVPNFEKMLSRESKDLPCYLNGITSRNIFIVNTDKSFKMNNYSNSTMYNLREDLNKNVNKYKNEKIKEMRKCLSFENLNIYKKDRYLCELDNKMKKFNRILSEMKE